ncbi:MAG: Gfo/Idh/MocA family oxidoreductase [Planctomycetes bacterium]|nr:Gfo/Idh/MocA family oxidoreductase [Planctomycetota bacterium]
MASTSRRTFLMGAGGGIAALAAGTGRSRAAQPEPIRLGLIGCGGMGSGHLRQLSSRKDARVAWVCDVDRNRLADSVKLVDSQSGSAPQATGDLRKVLDDASIEAVFIATPDHWHVPAAVLALDAGKHVYVEKPCSHNIHEGRCLVDAARRSGKRLQVGTQSRSTAVIREAIDRIRGGEIGEILVAKAWNSQRRGSIGKTGPTDPPDHLDFPMWLGPAPETTYRSNLLHGVWRWWYDFGCGDIGNDGVHDIDVACWGLGVTSHPSSVACIGNKYFFDDDQQFPDTQYAVFEYAEPAGQGRKRQLIFEQRIWSPYVQEGYENGAAFYGTSGLLVLGHSVGWKLYGERNRLIAENAGPADLVAHHQNFLDCVRGDAPDTNAPATAGHLAATLVHLANISARVGGRLTFDPETERITDHAEAAKMVGRTYRSGHWAIPRTA